MMKANGDEWQRDFPERHPLLRTLLTSPPPALVRFVDGSFRAWPSLADMNEVAAGLGLVNSAGTPLRFVPSPPKRRRANRGKGSSSESRTQAGPVSPARPVYEDRIAAAAEVQTRLASWHDFFNFLIWASFPRAKAALNARQVLVAGRDRGDDPGRVRTREQDRLAMLDEGGILLARDAAASRPPVPLVFGHAILETILRGRTAIRALACPVLVDTAALTAGGPVLRAAADHALADLVTHAQRFLDPTPFAVYDLEQGDVIDAGSRPRRESQSGPL